MLAQIIYDMLFCEPLLNFLADVAENVIIAGAFSPPIDNIADVYSASLPVQWLNLSIGC